MLIRDLRGMEPSNVSHGMDLRQYTEFSYAVNGHAYPKPKRWIVLANTHVDQVTPSNVFHANGLCESPDRGRHNSLCSIDPAHRLRMVVNMA